MKKIIKKIKTACQKAIDIIFPIECLNCKKEGRWLCETCAKKIQINVDPHCPACRAETTFGEYCANCQKNYSLRGAFISASYSDELVKKLIKTFKYRFVSSLNSELVKIMVFYLDELLKKSQRAAWLNQARGVDAPKILRHFKEVLVIPVPLHRRRERWRGFNQARVLAENFAQHYHLRINDHDLKRVKYTTSQAELNETQRRQNIKKSFVWQGGDLKSKNIMLVDDVLTTGATLDECASVLKKAGAGEIWGLVVAKN
ncbi:MAG: double zinc ribbon domain-containing protein [bacterium]|nr:double zinc ribbon domain-containing protein [bacterium]